MGENWEEGIGALLRIQPELSPEARSLAIAFEVEMRYRTGDARALRRLKPLRESDRIGDVFNAIQVYQTFELWAEVEETSRTALERFEGNRGLVFARASSLERLGRFDEAAALFSSLLEQDPNDVDAANYLGYMWADRGENLGRALELLQAVVEEEPGNAAFLDSLGWVYYRLENLGEAERWLRRAVEHGGAGDGTVLAHLGEVLLALGEVVEGRGLLQRSLDVGCDDPEHVRGLLHQVACLVAECKRRKLNGERAVGGEVLSRGAPVLSRGGLGVHYCNGSG